jgi:hypothetical protein
LQKKAENTTTPHHTSGPTRRTVTAVGAAFNTENQRVVLEAVALPSESTFLHLTYSYCYGALVKLALETIFWLSDRTRLVYRRQTGMVQLAD